MIDFDLLKPMLHSRVRNYALKGLTSHLVGGASPQHGTVRVLEMEQRQELQITPHSHKYALHCQVLRGEVINTLWRPALEGFDCDVSTLEGKLGVYERSTSRSEVWNFKQFHYAAGATYSMAADQVHSIVFSKGAVVLLFEGPETTGRSTLVQPSFDFRPPFVPFKVEPWMFEADQPLAQ